MVLCSVFSVKIEQLDLSYRWYMARGYSGFAITSTNGFNMEVSYIHIVDAVSSIYYANWRIQKIKQIICTIIVGINLINMVIF